MAQLVVVKGAAVGTVHPLPSYAVVIGRDAGCDLVIDDDRASRQHACIRLHKGEWEVRDLGSANGTLVGKERIADWTRVRSGALLRVGRTVFRFEDEAEAVAPAASAPARQEFPGFEVLAAVGRGATGTVYRARQLSLDRIVALKVLDPALAHRPETVERFIREARAAAALSHPHVVSVFEVVHHGSLHFFAMEFMDGGTVEDLLLASPGACLPWRETIRLVSAAAKGLAHLHAHGLVHRDVKPANLLLDRQRNVKLGDLGTLVRADDADAERIGTPHFMSPEQAQRLPVTRASDVYSLGATAYRMLAGRTPHHGRTPREIVERVATESPAPIEDLCPNLPPAVAELVGSMMAADPAARPLDAAELGRRLEETLQDVRGAAVAARRFRRVRSSLTGWLIALAVLGAFAWIAHRTGTLEKILAAIAEGPRASPPAAPGAGSDATADAAPRTPADLAREMFQDIHARERGLDDPSIANVAEWRKVAADYARLTEVFPLDSESAIRGHWRAKEIRDRLRLVTGGDAENAAFADRWVTRALRDVSPAGAAPMPGFEPADSGGADTESVEAVCAARDRVLRSADALVAKGRIQESLDVVLAWVREQRLAANARQAPGEVHEAIAGGIQWMRRTTLQQSARLEADLDRDRVLLRARFPETALLPSSGSPQSPAQALARLDQLEPLLVTTLAGDVVKARRERLRSISAIWAAIERAAPATAGADRAATRERIERAVARVLPVLDPGQRAGAVWLLVEVGSSQAAAAVLDDFGASVPSDAVKSARAEIAAAFARPVTGDTAAIAGWFAAHAGSHTALLGGGGPGDSPVFARGDVERFFESWGGLPRSPR